MTANTVMLNQSDKYQDYTVSNGTPVIYSVLPGGSGLQSREWIKIFSTITLLVSAVLLTFLACYTAGVFHHEQFIGPIGPAVCLGLSAFHVLISGSVLHFSLKKN